MKLKSLALAAALATGMAPAFAADQNINLSLIGSNANGNIYSGSFAALADGSGSLVGNPQVSNPDSILSGGTDVITFLGAVAGVYNVVLQGSASFVNALTGTLNGQPLSITSVGNVFTLFTTISTTSPDFALTLNGGALANSQYSGNITVSAIPEPETYALLLGGLGLMGFVARRRRPQK